ncbi:MAG: hypothetical protein ABSF83_16000 [Nitrososphaerales archaeon]
MSSPEQAEETRRRTWEYRRQLSLVLGILGAIVFTGLIVVVQNSQFITGSSAFAAGGYLSRYSAHVYLQLLVVWLAVLSGTCVAAFMVGVRSSLYGFATPSGGKALHQALDDLALLASTCFVGAAFILTLPLSEFGSVAIVVALVATFSPVLYVTRAAGSLPDDLLLEAKQPFQELQVVDLETSRVEPMFESPDVPGEATMPLTGAPSADGRAPAVPVAPSVQPAAADQPSAPTSRRPPGMTWPNLLIAALPGFFGLMGLAQLREGRWSRGAVFLAAGLGLGTASSWFYILPERIGELFSAKPMPTAASLSLWPGISSSGSLGATLVVALLGAFLVLWVLQLYDAMIYPVARMQPRKERNPKPSENVPLY